MKKKVTLKDGTEILIRPLTEGDLQKSLDFFRALPEKDRKYLRRDVTKKFVVEQRIHELKLKKARRLVALHGDKIVADGTLELEGHEWKGHVGELRLIVDHGYRHKGLGMIMARELYFLALSLNLEQILAKMMKPQIAAHSIFEKLGFKEEFTFHNYVKDIAGFKQDLIVMRCDLKSMWRELTHYIEEGDWQRTR